MKQQQGCSWSLPAFLPRPIIAAACPVRLRPFKTEQTSSTLASPSLCQHPPPLSWAAENSELIHVWDMLQSNRGGQSVLFILGTGLIVYSIFAVLNGFYVREFPTRVPSGVPHGQKTPMARAVSTMMTKASFR